MKPEDRILVLDSSAGVKWFREEAGSYDARELLRRHIVGELILAVDSLFYYEVLRAASRDRPDEAALDIWRDLRAYGLAEVRPDDETVTAAHSARERYGCSLYDAFPAGLADLLDAPLYSADARAHGKHPRVRLIG